MALLNYEPQIRQSVPLDGNITVRKDYVFDSPVTLCAGWWDLHIEKGDAWIFCNCRNFPLKAAQSMRFEPSDGDILIRRLYVKSTVKFRAVKLD